MRFEQTYGEKQIIRRMNQWRGALALVVLLSHIWGYTGIAFLVPFNKMVTIAVFLFFFLSGCGMVRSRQVKPGYASQIYRVKIPRLLFISALAYLAGAVLQRLLKVPVDAECGFVPLSVAGYVRMTNWYVYELIAFYVLFSLTGLIGNRAAELIVMAAASAVGFVALFHSGWVEAYYNSIFGFVAGMAAGGAPFSKWLKRWKRGYAVGLALMALSFAAMFVADKDGMLFAAVRNLAGVGAAIVLMYLSSRVEIAWRANDMLCRLSPELYFFHMPLALLLSRVIRAPYVFAGVVVVGSLALAAVFHAVDTWAHSRWLKWVARQPEGGGRTRP